SDDSTVSVGPCPRVGYIRMSLEGRMAMGHLSWRTLTRVALALSLVLGWATTGRAQSTLYDDFSASQLDPTKWQADQPVGGTGAGLELMRQISDSGLQLQHRILGGQNDNSGVQQSSNRLVFRTPYTAAVQFPVTVANVTVVG